jgi:hypothetical protein
MRHPNDQTSLADVAFRVSSISGACTEKANEKIKRHSNHPSYLVELQALAVRTDHPADRHGARRAHLIIAALSSGPDGHVSRQAIVRNLGLQTLPEEHIARGKIPVNCKDQEKTRR